MYFARPSIDTGRNRGKLCAEWKYQILTAAAAKEENPHEIRDILSCAPSINANGFGLNTKYDAGAIYQTLSNLPKI